MSGVNGQHAAHATPLPAGWASAPIAAVVAPMETANPAKNGPGEFLYVDIDAVDNIANRVASPKRLPRASPPSRARHVIRKNDVIISLVRPRLKNIAIVPPELDAQWASTAFCVCRPRTGVDARYLHYMFVQDEFLQAIKTYGDSPPSGHDDDLFNTIVPVAPSAEQIRIADRIDELFTDLAAGVAALERVKRNLSRYRAAVLHAAVTGRLTEAWRKQNGSPDEPGPKLLERILAERRRQWEERTRAKYEKAGKQPPKNWRERYPEPSPPKLPSDGSPLPELPEGWCWASVDQVVIEGLCNGISVKGTDAPPGVAALKLNAMSDRGFDYSAIRYIPIDDETAEDNQVHEGDFFVSRGNGSLHLLARGTVAQAPPVRVVFPDTMIRLRLCNGATWLPCMWPSRLVRAQIERMAKTTAGIYKVSQGDLAGLAIPLPPLAEQSAIVEAVNEKLSQIDALEAEVERGLARASRLRQAILKAAFEGRLVPQDPADEPASVLLERIKEQATMPVPTNSGDGHDTNGTVQRRRGRPSGSRKVASDAAATLAVSTPAKTKPSRKAPKR